jgi:hypothetical protein
MRGQAGDSSAGSKPAVKGLGQNILPVNFNQKTKVLSAAFHDVKGGSNDGNRWGSAPLSSIKCFLPRPTSENLSRAACHRPLMKDTFTGSPRMRARVFLRSWVGAWKRWREPGLARNARHPLAICAIFREEARFLDEWLAFHRSVGVTHFYLYNNFSTDGFRTVLKPWQEAGLVTLTDWPVKTGQLAAYEDCLKRFKNEARWIAFIDIDEFLFPVQERSIVPVLETYQNQPGVEVWEIFFGANGHVKRPDSPVTRAYTRCAPPIRTTVKTIANPRLVYKVGIHQFKYWTGTALDTAGHRPRSKVPPVFDRLQINHYWSRSLEDLEQKVQRGDCSTDQKRHLEWHHRFERDLNSQENTAILPLVDKIKTTPP